MVKPTHLRNDRKRRLSTSRLEVLESRQLFAADAGLLAVGAGQLVSDHPVSTIRDLGSVTPDAAVNGVAATANIPAASSVTFQFSIQLGGEYRLFVRHSGDDLTLLANTPGGSAELNPGPQGPFNEIDLKLAPGNYLITASAAGNQPVFVDWELILNNGLSPTSALTLQLVTNVQGTSNLGALPTNLNSDSSSSLTPSTGNASAAAPLSLTLETAPVGSPAALGQPAFGSGDLPFIGSDSPANPPPILVASIMPVAYPQPDDQPSAEPRSMMASESRSEAASTQELDEQSLQAVAWVDGLVARMRLSEPSADRAGSAPVSAQNDPLPVQLASDGSTRNDAQRFRIERPNLGPLMVMGIALVAVKYGGKIPKRKRPFFAVFRSSSAKAKARVDSGAKHSWQFPPSQWSPRPSSNRAIQLAMDHWGQESTSSVTSPHQESNGMEFEAAGTPSMRMNAY